MLRKKKLSIIITVIIVSLLIIVGMIFVILKTGIKQAYAFSPTYGRDGESESSVKPSYTVTKSQVSELSWNEMVSAKENDSYSGKCSLLEVTEKNGKMDCVIADLTDNNKNRSNFIEKWSEEEKSTSDGKNVSVTRGYATTCQEDEKDRLFTENDKGVSYYAVCTEKTSSTVENGAYTETTWHWLINCHFEPRDGSYNNLQYTAFTIDYSLRTENKGRFKIVKKAESGYEKQIAYAKETYHKDYYSVKGAVYGIYKNSNYTGKVGTVTINEDGYGISPELNAGKYYIKEETATESFALNSSGKSIEVKAGITSGTDLPVLNMSETPRTVNLSLEKTTSDNNPEEAAGACYTVWYSAYSGSSVKYYRVDEKNGIKTAVYVPSNNSKHNTYKIAEFTINSEGKGEITWVDNEIGAVINNRTLTKLPIGCYFIAETRSPDNTDYNINTDVSKIYVTDDVILNSNSNKITAQVNSNSSFKITFHDIDNRKNIMDISLNKYSENLKLTAGNALYGIEGAEYMLMYVPKSENGKLSGLGYDNIENIYDHNYIEINKDDDGRVSLENLPASELFTYVCTFKTESDGSGIVSDLNPDLAAKTELSDDNKKLYLKYDGMSGGTFFLFEIKAPDSESFAITTGARKAEINGESIVFSEAEAPLNDPVSLEIKKKDADNNNVSDKYSLEGTKFRIDYYENYYYSKEELPQNADRTWFYEVIDLSGSIYLSDPDYFIEEESDELFYDEETDSYIFPLGTMLITEVAPAPAYILDGMTIKAGENVFESDSIIAHIIADNDNPGEAKTVAVDGNRIRSLEVLNVLTVYDKVKRGDFSFKKKDKDGQFISDIKFKIDYYADGEQIVESHEVITDENGEFNSEDSLDFYIWNSGDENDWDKSLIDPEYGHCLPGKYVITELPCEANKYLSLCDPVEFFVTEDDLYNDGLIKNIDVGGFINYPEPEIRTSVTDSKNGSKLTAPFKNAVIKDSVEWKYLKAGSTWTIKGIIMEVTENEVKPFIDGSGKTVTGQSILRVPEDYEISPYEKSGHCEVIFNFNAEGYEGKNLVIYEYMFEGEDTTELVINDNEVDISSVYYCRSGKMLAHTDPDDNNQTIYIPSIGTKVAKTKFFGKKISVTDTVSYNKLEKGYTYTMISKLADTAGNIVYESDKSTVFTISDESLSEFVSGEENVIMEFEPEKIDVDKLVVYEYLYLGSYSSTENIDNDKLLAVHCDKNDKLQSFTIRFPIYIEKNDSVKGEPIKGSVMQIVNNEGIVLDKWTSNGKKHEFKLLPGEYILEETVAPDNYSLFEPVGFTVNDKGDIIVDGKTLNDNLLTLIDTPISMLPSTGGKGKKIFVLCGIMMLSLAACVKKSNESRVTNSVTNAEIDHITPVIKVSAAVIKPTAVVKTTNAAKNTNEEKSTQETDKHNNSKENKNGDFEEKDYVTTRVTPKEINDVTPIVTPENKAITQKITAENTPTNINRSTPTSTPQSTSSDQPTSTPTSKPTSQPISTHTSTPINTPTSTLTEHSHKWVQKFRSVFHDEEYHYEDVFDEYDERVYYTGMCANDSEENETGRPTSFYEILKNNGVLDEAKAEEEGWLIIEKENHDTFITLKFNKMNELHDDFSELCNNYYGSTTVKKKILLSSEHIKNPAGSIKVIDKEAYYEDIPDGYVCEECGKTKE